MAAAPVVHSWSREVVEMAGTETPHIDIEHLTTQTRCYCRADYRFILEKLREEEKQRRNLRIPYLGKPKPVTEED